MNLGRPLNKVEMAKDYSLDSYLLLPCYEECADSGKGRNKKKFNHSLSGWFEVENSPLRINTVFFIGTPNKLRTQLKKKEGIELEKPDDGKKNFEENFKGVDGLTFMLDRPDGSSLVVIWMPKFEWSVLDIETLCHECLHASVMVMRSSGVRSKIFMADDDDEVDDEGLCYRISTMMSSLIKKMIKKQNQMFKKGIEGSGKR